MKLLNSRQVADAVGVSPPTVRAWVKRGVLTPEIHVGALYRFDLAKVRKQLTAATAEAVAKQAEPTRLPQYL